MAWLFPVSVRSRRAWLDLTTLRAAEIVGRRLAGARPVLGICVGMQVLFDEGVEHGETTTGFGQWPGVVERLDAPILPHMGWNQVDVTVGEFDLLGSRARTLLLRALVRRSAVDIAGGRAADSADRYLGHTWESVRRRRRERTIDRDPVSPREIG